LILGFHMYNHLKLMDAPRSHVPVSALQYV
jgi:hypothetical protein